jgi:hypothetical protein
LQNCRFRQFCDWLLIVITVNVNIDSYQERKNMIEDIIRKHVNTAAAGGGGGADR